MKPSHIKILVIDLQPYWREYVSKILRDASYPVMTLDTYKEALQRSKDGAVWDLVLLGCANVSQEERILVSHLIVRQQPVIVLATTLSLQDMRSMFLQGAIDVTDKTYHPAEILTIVERTKEELIKSDRPWAPLEKGALL